MYDPNGDIAAMVNALRQRSPGVQMAGEVVPYDFTKHGNWQTAGPTRAPESAPYAWGNVKDPKIISIGKDVMQEWLRNKGNQYLGASGGNLPPAF